MFWNVLSRIYYFIHGPNPLDPTVWEGRLSPLTFRRFQPADLPQCLELYALNAPGRFPEGVVEKYEKALLHEASYYLVLEAAGRIIATGGISYYGREDIVVLTFGLVHPDHQGKGIGAALLLTRLALLKPIPPGYNVFISAVAKSIGYYQRFGFRAYQPWKDDQGESHPSGHLVLAPWLIRRCRALLKKHGVVYPNDEDRIPFQPFEEPATPPA